MLKRTFLIVISVSLLIAAGASAGDIIEAAKKGDFDAVRSIITANPEAVNAVDKDGCTALHYAAVEAYWDVFRLLLENNADVNTRNRINATPLHYACHHDRPDMIKLLIVRGADLNPQNIWGMSPLHTAVFRDCPRVAELLIDSGIDTTLVSKEGWSALHYATLSGHRHCYDLLVKRGLSAAAKDNDGKTALELWRERPQAIETDPNNLGDYVGVYENVLPVWIEGGKLYLKETSVEELYPLGVDTYFCEKAPWKVGFLRNEEGKVDRIELYFIRRTAVGRRTQ